MSNLCEIAISNNEDKKPPLMAAKTVKQGVEFDVLFGSIGGESISFSLLCC